MSTQGTDSWLTAHRAYLDQQKIAQAEAYEIAGFHAKSRHLLECGHLRLNLYCHDCGAPMFYTKTCKDRLCPSCLETKLFKLTKDLQPILNKVQRAKLLTLTVKSPPHLTKAAVTRLFRHFKKLRHRNLWEDAVRGGIYGLDFSWSDAGCNLHIHALLDADYIPWKLLQEAWKAITHGAWNVDIREVDATNGLGHVVKYALRGANFLQEPDRLREFIAVMHGRHAFSPFGSFWAAQRADPKINEVIDVLELTDEEFLEFLHRRGRLPCPECGGFHTDRAGISLHEPLSLPHRQLELDHSHERS